MSKHKKCTTSSPMSATLIVCCRFSTTANASIWSDVERTKIYTRDLAVGFRKTHLCSSRKKSPSMTTTEEQAQAKAKEVAAMSTSAAPIADEAPKPKPSKPVYVPRPQDFLPTQLLYRGKKVTHNRKMKNLFIAGSDVALLPQELYDDIFKQAQAT